MREKCKLHVNFFTLYVHFSAGQDLKFFHTLRLFAHATVAIGPPQREQRRDKRQRLREQEQELLARLRALKEANARQAWRPSLPCELGGRKWCQGIWGWPGSLRTAP